MLKCRSSGLALASGSGGDLRIGTCPTFQVMLRLLVREPISGKPSCKRVSLHHGCMYHWNHLEVGKSLQLKCPLLTVFDLSGLGCSLGQQDYYRSRQSNMHPLPSTEKQHQHVGGFYHDTVPQLGLPLLCICHTGSLEP